jgi:hypothetical protein
MPPVQPDGNIGTTRLVVENGGSPATRIGSIAAGSATGAGGGLK